MLDKLLEEDEPPDEMRFRIFAYKIPIKEYFMSREEIIENIKNYELP